MGSGALPRRRRPPLESMGAGGWKMLAAAMGVKRPALGRQHMGSGALPRHCRGRNPALESVARDFVINWKIPVLPPGERHSPLESMAGNV